jgi:hypothetical protein
MYSMRPTWSLCMGDDDALQVPDGGTLLLAASEGRDASGRVCPSMSVFASLRKYE